MDDQSVYINQLQEDLEAKLEQIEKLEGWLKYLWGGGYPIDDIDVEIDSYIKELEKP